VAFSLRLPVYWIVLMVGGISLLLSFGSLWSIDLKTEHLPDVYRLSGITAWLMILYSGVISFWPIRPFMAGLVLTSCLYALLGILEQRLGNKGFNINYFEFVLFNLIIVLIAFLTSSWRG